MVMMMIMMMIDDGDYDYDEDFDYVHRSPKHAMGSGSPQSRIIALGASPMTASCSVGARVRETFPSGGTLEGRANRVSSWSIFFTFFGLVRFLFRPGVVVYRATVACCFFLLVVLVLSARPNCCVLFLSGPFSLPARVVLCT